MARTIEVEELLRHAGWLQRLAAGLVGDGSADDLVQDTWVAALRSPPKDDGAVRPWLARVVRNLEQHGDLVVRAASSLFVRDDLDQDASWDLQHDLGASGAAERRWSSDPRASCTSFEAVYRPRADGRYLLVGLRPGVPFDIEVRDRDGRALALRRAEVARGEWARLEIELDR